MFLFTSDSSRRRDLLRQIGFVEQEDYYMRGMSVNLNYDETGLTNEKVCLLSVEAARRKVEQAVVNSRYLDANYMRPTETIVVGADTVVFCEENGRVYDRPLLISKELASPEQKEEARQRARAHLRELSGKEITIITGLWLAQGDNLAAYVQNSVVTTAKMKAYTDKEIDRYVSTDEPLDKAGAFGIQEKGVALFDHIIGSYSNVVGLPLAEFVESLSHPYFSGRVRIPRAPIVHDGNASLTGPPAIRVVSVGDINYDLIYDKLPEDFLAKLAAPGAHIKDEMKFNIGGTGVNFALKAKDVGFKSAVLGVISGDVLGKQIEERLHAVGIDTLLPADYDRRTSMALILRDKAGKDTSLMITDSDQALTQKDVRKALPELENAHLVFISGYCLSDLTRRKAALEIMDSAKKAGSLVVLDLTVGFHRSVRFDEFVRMARGKVDVLIAELTTIICWRHEDAQKKAAADLVLEKRAKAQNSSTITVVISSPSGDVDTERNLVAKIVDDYGELFEERGIHLRSLRWENDVLPGSHREHVADLIEKQLDIEHCDLYIGIFWNRFGTPFYAADSGTLHEYYIARQGWDARNKPRIMVFFCNRPASLTSEKQLEDRLKVIRFKESLDKQFYKEYKDIDEFGECFREYLKTFLRKFEKDKQGSGEAEDVSLVTELEAERELLRKFPETNEGHLKSDVIPFFVDALAGPQTSACPVMFLRRSDYSHEYVVIPRIRKGQARDLEISSPVSLSYSERKDKIGYGDELTARRLYGYMAPKLLLASASPRRIELLRQIVSLNKIEVVPSNHSEEVISGEAPDERVKRLAYEKANSILESRSFSASIEVIIGADTEAFIEDSETGTLELIPQPKNDEEARTVLTKLSGKTHTIVTGIALVSPRSNRQPFLECVGTVVKFKELTPDEIKQYIATGEAIGKAGGYAIQGMAALFVEAIKGSYSNVVGLPLERLCDILRDEFGLPIWDIDRVSNWRLDGNPYNT